MVLKVRYSELGDAHDAFMKIHQAIVDHLINNNCTDAQFDVEEIVRIVLNIFKLELILLITLQYNTSLPVVSQTYTSIKPNVKLPTLEIPTFSSGITFFDLFDALTHKCDRYSFRY